jgi:TonB-linked SusC/RagA family outer membrane protein
MKKILPFFILCFCMLGVIQTFAQSRTVTGTVTSSADGLAIPGVSVKVQGTTVGTQTNVDGKFTVKASGNSVLILSFIGFTTKTVPVGDKTDLKVVLESRSGELDEVVVTGVGVATSKRLVAIDVATLDSKDFPKSATTNVTQALTGQIAGAQFVQKTSQPGAAPTIQLRGFTNLGSTQPLILIDGVQTSNDISNNNNNILTSIDPNIVDHIEIVKGSAGGMLYGAQGGNGVIQIFTKKGARNSKLSVDISSKYSNDRIIELNDIVAKMHHYVTDADGNILNNAGKSVGPNADGIYTDPASMPFGTDPTVQNNKVFKVPTYDHVQQANRVANTFTNSVNIRGGADKSDFAFGVSNLQQQDVFSNSYNRTNLNLNLGFNLAKGLTIRNSTQLFYTWSNLEAGSRFNMIMTPRYIDLDYIDPNTGRHVVKPSIAADGNNPLAERDVHSTYKKVPRLLETFDVNYKFTKFVEFDAKFSEDASISDGFDLYSNQTGLPQTVFFGNAVTGSIADANITSRTEYGNASMYFRTDFKNDFHINLPIKTTTQVTYDFTRQYSHTYRASGTVLPAFPPYTITGSGTKTASDLYDGALYFGYLVNQTIDYANLVGISGGFRSDYSSAFGGASTPFTFPRGTIYVNPSELFRSHELVSNWKLRGAFGEAGVQPGNFDRQVTLTSTTVGATNGLTSLIIPTTLTNPNLRVQVTKELEVGTDITVTPFKKSNWVSSITFSGSYWHRTSNDDEQTAMTAPSSGGTGLLSNLISLTGHGVDLSLDVNAYRSTNFDWYFGGRFAIAHTYVTKVSNGIPINSGIFTIAQGSELGTITAQTPLHSVDQLKPDGSRYIATTDVGNYTMVNGNVVNKTTYGVVLSAANDLSTVGNVNPNFTSSLINRFNIYKKLSVSFQFDWNHGQKIYNATRQYLARDQLSSDFDKSVTINGKTGSFVAYWNSYYNALNPVSSFVEDGSFIRLRDASISYDLTSVAHARWIKSLIFTVTGRNLLTFTKYSGLDPEVTGAVSTSSGGALNNIGSNAGVDYYGQPNLKSFQFSFNIGL